MKSFFKNLLNIFIIAISIIINTDFKNSDLSFYSKGKKNLYIIFHVLHRHLQLQIDSNYRLN